MSTFFEKLTNAAANRREKDENIIEPETEPEVNLAASKEDLRRPVKRPIAAKADSRPTRLKVDTEEAGEMEEIEDENEEGELTVDIYDKGDEIVIQSTVAGVRPEDLDVSVSNDSVTIRGRRERAEEIKEDNYYYKELFWGTFSRSVILPEEIEEDASDASLKHGLLTIRLPKKKRGTIQKLKVKLN